MVNRQVLMVDIIIVDIDRLLWMIDKYRRGSSLASAGIPAQSTLTLGSLWHGNILFIFQYAYILAVWDNTWCNS